MYSVYVINLSSDGIHNEGAKTVSKLFKIIESISYKAQTINLGNKDVKFNYGNLCDAVKEAKERNRFTLCNIMCENEIELTVMNVTIQ